MNIEISTNVDTIHNKTKFDKTIIKDILEKSKLKNPTRERALHAEENAFFQGSRRIAAHDMTTNIRHALPERRQDTCDQTLVAAIFG